MFKKIVALLMAVAMVAGLMAVLPVSVAAGEPESTPSVWSGKANVKWYVEGKAEGVEEWHVKTAEDLAGLAWIVGAGNPNACYSGIYYDAEYNVLGFQKTDISEQKPYADGSRCYKPKKDDGSTLIEGHEFLYETVYLDADILLNEGNAADWAETPPANVWFPIGGCINPDATEPGFNGIFEGEGHTISGAYYSTEDKNLFAVGLFGYAGSGGSSQFKNLKLKNSFFRSGQATATICGRSNKPITIKNCLVEDCIVINYSGQGGGLVGGVFNGAGLFENCQLRNVSVEATRYVGGFVGCVNGVNVTVKNCSITGTVTARAIEVEKDDGNIAYTFGCEAGIIIGRAAGGAYDIENFWSDVTVNQFGKPENQNTAAFNKARAGVLFAGCGNDDSYPPYSIESIFCVNKFNATEVVGIDEIDGAKVLDPYYKPSFLHTSAGVAASKTFLGEYGKYRGTAGVDIAGATSKNLSELSQLTGSDFSDASKWSFKAASLPNYYIPCPASLADPAAWFSSLCGTVSMTVTATERTMEDASDKAIRLSVIFDATAFCSNPGAKNANFGILLISKANYDKAADTATVAGLKAAGGKAVKAVKYKDTDGFYNVSVIVHNITKTSNQIVAIPYIGNVLVGTSVTTSYSAVSS